MVQPFELKHLVKMLTVLALEPVLFQLGACPTGYAISPRRIAWLRSKVGEWRVFIPKPGFINGM